MFLHMTQKDSTAKYSVTRLTATVSSKDDRRLANAKDFSNVSHENIDEPTATKQALIATTRSRCFFCSRAYNEGKYCPATNSTCFSCGKIGHFFRVCRSNNGSGEKVKMYKSKATLFLASLTAVACPENLLSFSILVSLNVKNLTVLIDSGSSESYINS